MKHIFIILSLLFPVSFFAQIQPIKIGIDSIITIDSISCRKFAVSYSIENLSETKISFILNSNQIQSGSSGSLQTAVSANLFQENENLPFESIMVPSYKKMINPIPDFESIKNDTERNNALKKYLKEALDYDFDAEIKKIKEDVSTSNPKIKSSKNIMKSIMTMLPHEVKHFSKTFYWNKNRYRKINDLQYYINEKSNCYFELYIVLLKEEYKEKMLESDYNDLIKIPNFIKGWFSSNKVEINFKE